MKTMGEDAGRCIHRFKHEEKVQCSILGKECTDESEDRCLDFIPR
jgi:hypothetical protein